MSFVDLAGSKYYKKNEIDTAYGKLKIAINQSLSALEHVIEALIKGRDHIPYRDHALTKLLKDSIGGSAYTYIIINVIPSDSNEFET